MAKSFLNFFLFFTSVFLLYSCASKKIIPGKSIIDPIVKSNYINLLNNQYPDSFAFTQRILLNVAGKQYDFIGQLTINRGVAYRAVAFGEMGGQFIELLARGDSISLLANPTNLPEKPILRGVAEDIKQLFYYNKIKNLNYSNLASGIVKISINTSENEQLIYLINPNNNEILNLNYFSGNILIRSAEFLEYKKQNSWERTTPSCIKLTNHRWHYSLEIRLLKFSTIYDANKVFKTN
jgi:hypothetical protein